MRQEQWGELFDRDEPDPTRAQGGALASSFKSGYKRSQHATPRRVITANDRVPGFTICRVSSPLWSHKYTVVRDKLSMKSGG